MTSHPRPSSSLGHFEQHLRDAIHINRSRRAYYKQIAGWPAQLLSLLLVGSERICLPLARYFDKKALPFNREGIGIVKNDFIDMGLVASKDKLPEYRNQASSASFKDIKQRLKVLRREGAKLLKNSDFVGLSSAVADTLEWLLGVSNKHQAHFAMTQHLLESLGLAALNADAYVRKNQTCLKLAKRLVGIQLKLCDSGLIMDRLAQKCHAKGVGIIVNDVPDIPFLTKWKRFIHTEDEERQEV